MKKPKKNKVALRPEPTYVAEVSGTFNLFSDPPLMENTVSKTSLLLLRLSLPLAQESSLPGLSRNANILEHYQH